MTPFLLFVVCWRESSNGTASRSYFVIGIARVIAHDAIMIRSEVWIKLGWYRSSKRQDYSPLRWIPAQIITPSFQDIFVLGMLPSKHFSRCSHLTIGGLETAMPEVLVEWGRVVFCRVIFYDMEMQHHIHGFTRGGGDVCYLPLRLIRSRSPAIMCCRIKNTTVHWWLRR